MRLDNTAQVLPAPPFRKIDPRSIAVSRIRLAPARQFFDRLVFGKRLLSAFVQMRLGIAAKVLQPLPLFGR